MSTYIEHYKANCRWCNGVGAYLFYSGTCNSEESFQCFSCGQLYRAEGDYLEEKTVFGGHGAIFVMTSAENLPRGLLLGDFPTENIWIFRRSQSAKVNAVLLERLAQTADWVLQTEYDLNSANRESPRRYVLDSGMRRTTVIKGTPPSFETLIEKLVGTWPEHTIESGEQPSNEQVSLNFVEPYRRSSVAHSVSVPESWELADIPF